MNKAQNKDITFFGTSHLGGSPANTIISAASTMTIEPIEWLWEGWLAVGKLHLIAGVGGVGKTTLALSMAATITNKKRCWPDGSQATKGSVLIWSGEDFASDSILPRLMACGADLTKCYLVEGFRGEDGHRPFNPATDIADMAMALKGIGDVRLIIIDPIVSAITGDDHKTATVRRCLQPIVDMAKSLGIAVIGITHFTKGSEDADPLDRVIGSQAFGSLARVVLCAAKSNDGDRRVLVRAKSNIGPDGGGFAYTTRREEVKADIHGQYIEWGDALEGSPNRLLRGVEGDSSEIEGWLLDVLKPAPMISRAVKKLAEREGFAWRTVQRKASDMAQVSMTRSGFGKDIHCLWSII